MEWYAKLILFILALTTSFYIVWQIDFNRFMRINRKEYAIFVYVIVSLALGYLVGRLLIELGEIFQSSLTGIIKAQT